MLPLNAGDKYSEPMIGRRFRQWLDKALLTRLIISSETDLDPRWPKMVTRQIPSECGNIFLHPFQRSDLVRKPVLPEVL